MNKTKTMFISSLVYFVGRGLSGIVTMLMLPIYTNQISADNYGYYETINSVVIFIIPVLCVEIWTGMLKYALNRTSNKCDYTENDVYSVGFFVLNIGCIVYAAGCTILYLIRPYPYFWLILLSGISLAYACNEGYVARSEKKNATYAMSGVIGTFVNAASGIVCVYVFGMQAEALFIAYTAGNIAQIIWLELNNKLFIKRKLKLFRIDRKLLKPMVIFCIPLGINSIVYYLMNNFNKLFISGAMGDAAVGIFSVAGKFMAIATAVAAVIQYAWTELTFSLGDDEDKAKIYNSAMKIVTRLSLFLVLGMLPAIHVVFPYLIGTEYSDAFALIPIYYFSLGFTIINGFLTNILRAENDTKTGLIGKIIACVFSLASLVLLIKPLGLQAAGISMTLGAIVEYICLSVALRKFKIKIYPISLLVFTVCYVVASLAFYSSTILYSCIVFGVVAIAFIVMNKNFVVTTVKRIFKKEKN